MAQQPSRIIAVVVACLAAGSIAACGGAPAGAAARTVAYVPANLTRSYAQEAADGFRVGVATVPGVQQRVVAPSTENDPVAQAELFTQMLDTAPGGVSVSMVSPERFTECFAAAAAKHVPVITVDIPPPPGDTVSLYVGNDNQELGTALADLVIDRLPAAARGTVLLGTPRAGVRVLDQRALAVRAQFQRRLPRVTVLGPFDLGQQPAGNRRAWHQLLAANPHPLAVLSVGADGAMLAQVRQAARGSWLAAAFDIDRASLAAVKRGELLLISPEHFLKGAIAGRLQAQHADHRSPLPRGWIYTAGLAVTPENIDSIIKRQSSLAAKQAWFAGQVDHIFGPDGPQLRDLSEIR